MLGDKHFVNKGVRWRQHSSADDLIRSSGLSNSLSSHCVTMCKHFQLNSLSLLMLAAVESPSFWSHTKASQPRLVPPCHLTHLYMQLILSYYRCSRHKGITILTPRWPSVTFRFMRTVRHNRGATGPHCCWVKGPFVSTLASYPPTSSKPLFLSLLAYDWSFYKYAVFFIFSSQLCHNFRLLCNHLIECFY